MSPSEFFAQLWLDYIRLAPQAARIHALFSADNRAESSVDSRAGNSADNPVIINDHVAFRTFNLAPISLAHLEPLLLAMGYRRYAPYDFPDKHLSAWSYTAPDSALPRIFFSELDVAALSPTNAAVVTRLVAAVSPQQVKTADVFWAGRLWPMPSWAEYQSLLAESEYAAWVAAIGLRANHFTMAVHALQPPLSLEAVVARVSAAGFVFNRDGGVIKGQPAEYLEQAATLADRQAFTFADADVHEIPTCYYEFARRYPDASGVLYEGFVAANAAQIFTSTNVRQASNDAATLPAGDSNGGH